MGANAERPSSVIAPPPLPLASPLSISSLNDVVNGGHHSRECRAFFAPAVSFYYLLCKVIQYFEVHWIGNMELHRRFFLRNCKGFFLAKILIYEALIEKHLELRVFEVMSDL